MITYNWSVNSMEVLPNFDGEQNVVVNVQYTFSGVEGNYSSQISDNMDFIYSGGSFTPYEDLTEAQVIGWVQNRLGATLISSMEAGIKAQIDSQKTPPLTPEILPLPWKS
jgi:hypothetical protein